MTMNPDLAIRCYDRPKGSLRSWLETIAVRGSAPAGELVEAVCAERAPPLLRAAMELGLIERTYWAPSTEQRFFGVGGTSIENANRDFHVECWRYALTPKGHRWLEAHR